MLNYLICPFVDILRSVERKEKTLEELEDSSGSVPEPPGPLASSSPQLSVYSLPGEQSDLSHVYVTSSPDKGSKREFYFLNLSFYSQQFSI